MSGRMFSAVADLPEAQRHALAVLREFDEWPSDDGKDAALIARLAKLYPEIDLVAEAGSWLEWIRAYRERHPRKAIAPRHRFSNWMKNARRFRSQRAAQHRAAADPDEHGDTRLAEW